MSENITKLQNIVSALESGEVGREIDAEVQAVLLDKTANINE